MKEQIQYYYNLFPQRIWYREKYIEFVFSSNHYYLMLETGNLKKALLIDKILKFNKVDIYDFILNRNHQYISKIYNKNYVLLKLLVEKTNKEIDFNELILFSKINVKIPAYVSWEKRWIRKNDIMEKCREILISKNAKIGEFLDYFLETTENAIIYLNYNILKSENNNILSLQHERLSSIIKKRLNFYNPFFIILDNYTRDISELIKQFAFEKKNYKKLIEIAIKRMNLNYKDLKLIMARIMFPTYFFDYVENKNRNEKKIITYAGYYVKIINEIAEVINHYAEIPIPYHH